MSELDEIPEPDNSGSSGLQKDPESPQNMKQAQPLPGQLSVSAAELAAADTKVFGKDFGAAAFQAWIVQIETKSYEDKKKIDSQDKAINELKDKNSDQRARIAALEERLRGYGKNKHLRNVAISGGSGLIGIALNMLQTSFDAISLGALALGCLFTVLGWLSGPDGDDK